MISDLRSFKRISVYETIGNLYIEWEAWFHRILEFHYFLQTICLVWLAFVVHKEVLVPIIWFEILHWVYGCTTVNRHDHLYRIDIITSTEL